MPDTDGRAARWLCGPGCAAQAPTARYMEGYVRMIGQTQVSDDDLDDTAELLTALAEQSGIFWPGHPLTWLTLRRTEINRENTCHNSASDAGQAVGDAESTDVVQSVGEEGVGVDG